MILKKRFPEYHNDLAQFNRKSYEIPLTIIRHTVCAPSEGRGIILVTHLAYAKVSFT